MLVIHALLNCLVEVFDHIWDSLDCPDCGKRCPHSNVGRAGAHEADNFGVKLAAHLLGRALRDRSQSKRTHICLSGVQVTFDLVCDKHENIGGLVHEHIDA